MNSKFLAFCVASLLTATVDAQTITRETFATGFSAPIWVGSPDGDYDRVFVGEQAGRIRLVKNGVTTLFLDITGPVRSGGERGLLGIAFHPDYNNNGYFYVNYTRDPDGATVVERYQRSSTNPDVANASSGTLMHGPVSQPFSNHNAGCIQFGPDGYLYIAHGDGGSGGDPGCRAQNRGNFLGKMLRVDVDANPNGPAVAPASNPFVGVGGTLDEIWHIGLRNPWRFSFDRETGDMWIGDVGQNALEELNFLPASSTGGENLGWKVMEGTNCFAAPCNGAPSCNSPLLTDPIRTLPTSQNCSIVGGYRYRGCAMPGLRGTYFHGDYCSGRIWSMEWNGSSLFNIVDQTSVLGGGSLTSFGEDAYGEIYYCAGSNVYKIVPDGILSNNDAGPGSQGSNGLTPIYEACGVSGLGNTTTLLLRDAPANSNAAVIFGVASNPVTLPIPGFGDLVPVPVSFQIPLTTDADGEASFEVPGGVTALPVYHQAAIIDLGIGGVTLSNALFTVFNAAAAPIVSTINPLSAAPGSTITINGSDFLPGATVTVGGSPVATLTNTPSAITFSMPAGVPCDSTVVVTNPDSQFDSASFNPTPAVNNTINNSGPAAGGTGLIIIGSGFAPNSTVTIGGNPATITTASATVIICNTPPGTPGVANVLITTPGGCTTTTTFTYL